MASCLFSVLITNLVDLHDLHLDIDRPSHHDVVFAHAHSFLVSSINRSHKVPSGPALKFAACEGLLVYQHCRGVSSQSSLCPLWRLHACLSQMYMIVVLTIDPPSLFHYSSSFFFRRASVSMYSSRAARASFLVLYPVRRPAMILPRPTGRSR